MSSKAVPLRPLKALRLVSEGFFVAIVSSLNSPDIVYT
ncbi:MAG: hypothetical protein JWR09_4759 [Mucilaginibacter sp.]|nr:hypothetical protein [Mucilaginibacter sp.]